jgi:hypothetical protein
VAKRGRLLGGPPNRRQTETAVGTQYGNSPGEFYALNATNGLIAWQAPFPIGLVGHACSRPYVAQADVPYVFVVGGTGPAYAFAWNDGWYAWSAPAGDGSDLMEPRATCSSVTNSVTSY